MTEITYTHTATHFSIEFRGHAGFAEQGKDIVCAGISVLASELMLACEQAREKGEIKALKMEKESGFVAISFQYVAAAHLAPIIGLIIQCAELLECEYGEYIHIHKSNEKSKSIRLS